jgi:Cytochrome C'
MMSAIRCLAIPGVGSVLGVCILVAPHITSAADDKGSAGMLPEAAFTKLVERATKHVLEGVQGAQSGEKKYRARYGRQARAAAAMIAAYAQDGPASRSPAQRASLRDAALQLLATLKADKWDEARKQADALKTVKEDSKADPKPVALMPAHIDLLDVMQQFSSLPGGLGIERDRILDVLANREVKKAKTLPEKVMNEDYILTAYQMAVIADVVKDHKPPKVKGGGVKEWQSFTDDMRKSALDLAETVQKKDGKAALAALNKLNSSCRNCHEVFRPMD